MGPVRPVKVCGDVAHVALTKGKTAVIDAADAHLVFGRNWCFRGPGYAFTRINKNIIAMHRLISRCPEGKEPDHIDGDRLNNRRLNLRVVGRFQNTWNNGIRSDNTSGIRGVTWDSVNSKWRVTIGVSGKYIRLGRFSSLEEARAVREAAEIKYYGEYRRGGLPFTPSR